jgi:hypothetical protein
MQPIAPDPLLPVQQIVWICLRKCHAASLLERSILTHRCLFQASLCHNRFTNVLEILVKVYTVLWVLLTPSPINIDQYKLALLLNEALLQASIFLRIAPTTNGAIGSPKAHMLIMLICLGICALRIA